MPGKHYLISSLPGKTSRTLLNSEAEPDIKRHSPSIRYTFPPKHMLEMQTNGLDDTVGERSGSVVECLTPDWGARGSSLTGVTALWSLSKTHLS